MSSAKPDSPQSSNETVDEASVVEDIAYFESRLAELQRLDSSCNTAAVQVYRLLVRQRRQLLAAIRDGRPAHWPEYAIDD